MGFDIKKFNTSKFQARVEDVPLPDSDIKMFFPDGEKPVWKVRGLTGNEYGFAMESAANNNIQEAVVDAIATQHSKEVTKAVKDMMGVGGVMPKSIAKKIYLLKKGSVDPVCDQETALRLCKYFPIEFLIITRKIEELTGLGYLPGKPGGCTTSPESEAF